MTQTQKQVADTLKKAMRKLPPGEHLHIASVIFEQAVLIGKLRAEIRQLKRELKEVRP